MQSPDANVAGEMRVRQALNRRARAFDLAQLCAYTTMEAWHERVFEVLQKEPAPNAMSVTMRQLKEADKMLFRKLAEKTRGALAQQPDGSKPMETHFEACANNAEVQFCLIPMVKGAPRANSVDTPSPKQKGKGKGSGKVRKDYNKPSYGAGAQPLPPNCHQMTPQGKPICNTFNRGTCDFAKPGKGAREAFMCAGSASNRSLFPHVTIRDRRHPLFGENLEQPPGNEPSQCIRLHRPSMTRCKVFPDESSTTRALFCEVLQGVDG